MSDAGWDEASRVDNEGRALAPPGWGQGRASYGGLIAAIGLRGLQAKLVAPQPLRSLMASFVAPVAPGPVAVQATVWREGRALSQGTAQVVAAGEVCAVLQAAFGPARLTGMPAVVGAPPPASPRPDEMLVFPYLEGVTPEFTKHFDYRMDLGRLPFTGAKVASLGGWVRFRTAAPVDAAAILGLLDAWPAPVLPLLQGVAPASTATWMVNLATDVQAQDPAGWWRFEGTTSQAAHGIADVDGRLWAPDGSLAATSRQLVVEFSRPA